MADTRIEILMQHVDGTQAVVGKYPPAEVGPVLELLEHHRGWFWPKEDGDGYDGELEVRRVRWSVGKGELQVEVTVG